MSVANNLQRRTGLSSLDTWVLDIVCLSQAPITILTEDDIEFRCVPSGIEGVLR